MSQAVITYNGMPPPELGHAFMRPYPFQPGFKVRVDGILFLQVDVVITFEASVNAISDLANQRITEEEAFQALNNALLLYGIRHTEALVADLLATDSSPEQQSQQLDVTTEDVAQLVALAMGNKRCTYRVRDGRDLFCTAAGPADSTAVYQIGGRRTAPTAQPLCNTCELPNEAALCTHLLHPVVQAKTTDQSGVVARHVVSAICDRGQPAIARMSGCQAGYHSCWQRIVRAEASPSTPLSPLSLPESFDVLDAMWRLTFGINRRLLARGTFVGPAVLTMDCTNRVEFESRMSALADVFSRLRVEDDLLPAAATQQEKAGTISRMQSALLSKLPATQHEPVKAAIKTLRRINEARNVMQHSRAGGGFPAALRELGIRDAPPNWQGAWDSIRRQTADALTSIRGELQRWVDAQDN